jgi:hypothetical protein
MANNRKGKFCRLSVNTYAQMPKSGIITTFTFAARSVIICNPEAVEENPILNDSRLNPRN